MTVADFGRPAEAGVRMSVLSSKASQGEEPARISGGNAESGAGAAPGGKGGSGFTVRRAGSEASGTCPRTRDGCSVATGG